MYLLPVSQVLFSALAVVVGEGATRRTDHRIFAARVLSLWPISLLITMHHAVGSNGLVFHLANFVL
jgi:hypothetical protein